MIIPDELKRIFEKVDSVVFETAGKEGNQNGVQVFWKKVLNDLNSFYFPPYISSSLVGYISSFSKSFLSIDLKIPVTAFVTIRHHVLYFTI